MLDSPRVGMGDRYVDEVKRSPLDDTDVGDRGRDCRSVGTNQSPNSQAGTAEVASDHGHEICEATVIQHLEHWYACRARWLAIIVASLKAPIPADSPGGAVVIGGPMLLTDALDRCTGFFLGGRSIDGTQETGLSNLDFEGATRQDRAFVGVWHGGVSFLVVPGLRE
jgi:hypothetical protein